MHPDVLPDGFALTQGNEYELGATNWLMYTTPGYGDRPYLEFGRYLTTLPLERLSGASQHQPVTVQGKPGLLSNGAPGGSDWMTVDWSASAGVALFVTGYKIPEPEVLAVADHVRYVPGTEFTYPAQPKVTVTRDRALSILSSPTSSSRAVLTSFGEVDAVLQTTGPINRVPTLNLGVDVVRPVWVVWSAADARSLNVQKGAVIDANSAAKLADLTGAKSTSLLSLTDRSQRGCEPPFGVLTRSEFTFLEPEMPGTTGAVKLMKLQMLRSIKEGSTMGNCALAACDPGVPVWVWTGTASDCSLMFRCYPPPNASGAPPPSFPPGSWALRPYDARTGPQNTGLSGEAAGHGSLPADVADLPDLAPRLAPPAA